MRYELKTSFDRSVKRLSDDAKTEIKKAVFEIIDIVATGKRPSKGQSLTRLPEFFCEFDLKPVA